MFDLMALDSLVMKTWSGNSLPYSVPDSSRGNSGVNLFAQDLTYNGSLMQRPDICFPPFLFVGSVLLFLIFYPGKYWWRLLHHNAK